MNEDRWQKLEEILRRVIREELDSRGLKSKAKIGFVNGRWTGITEEQLSAWRDAYALDVDAELKKMAAWLVSNPHLAPKSNFGRFANTWLAKQHNTLSIRSIPTKSDGTTKPAPNLCAYCLAPAKGSINGYRYCPSDECWSKAMSGERPGKMPGIPQKQVAGAD